MVITRKLDFAEFFDFAFLLWLAVFVAYGQQGGGVARLLVHTSTFLFLAAGIGLFFGKCKMKFRIPVHTFWYVGLMIIGLLSSRYFNDTNEMAGVLRTVIRILFASFMCAVRINVKGGIESILRKIYWLGIIEIFLLLLCIPTDEWLVAFRGGRLGIGSLELNVCALLLSVSILGCIYNTEEGGKKYFIIAGIQFLVLIMFQSRTGYLALAIGMLVYCCAKYKLRRKYVELCILALIIVVGLAMFILFFTDVGNKFFTRLFQYDDSIMYRTLILKTSVEIWFEKPFWGHGIGMLPELMLERLNYPWAAHNNLVGLSTSVGVVGLIWYYGFTLCFTIHALYIQHKDKTIAILKSLLVICVVTDISCENYIIVLTQIILAIAIESMRRYSHYDYRNKDNT